MSKKKHPTAKPIPVCPVKGCKATQPHEDEPFVKGIIQQYKKPDKLLGWVQESLTEIHDSCVDDCAKDRHFAWFTRLRQIEEMYTRTLYILFLATDDEVPHWLSGDLPNSVSKIYDDINRHIFGGKGLLRAPQNTGSGAWTALNVLHSGGHADYKAMAYAVVWKPTEQKTAIEEWFKYVRMLIQRVEYMKKMFKAGKDKQTVRAAMIALHT